MEFNWDNGLNPFEIREGLKLLALEMCCKSMACRGLYG